MATVIQSPVRQANEQRTRVRRNAYRDVAIEYYARNSSSVLTITHRHWPDQPWSSQPELARILSAELGWELDYRSLSRQLRWVHRFDASVRNRIFELLGDKALYAPDFCWNAVCGRWNLACQQEVVPLSSELAHNTFRHSVTQIGCRNSSSSQGLKILGSPKKIN